MVTIVALGSIVWDRDVPAPRIPAAAPAVIDPAAVLAEAPYAGVACRVANSAACDRMGLAVWTRRPARAVRATVAGREFRLDDPEWSGPARRGMRRMFAGFLAPAGLVSELGVPQDRWEGEPAVRLRIRLEITAADGSRQVTNVDVQLAPGWG